MKNKIIDKLRKLIAHEQSARSIGNQVEAEAFAGRIQELLTAHKLSMSEIEFEEREAAEPIDFERVDLRTEVRGSNRANLAWRVFIARAVAEANSCAVVNLAGTRGTAFSFVGRTSDRQLAKVLYLYLVELGEELATKAAKEDREVQRLKFNLSKGIMSYDVPKWVDTAFNAWMKSYRESWKVGFGEAVAKRIKDRYTEIINAQQGAGAAIIHIKKDALAVQDYLRGKTHKTRGSMGRDDSNQDGYKRGQNTGNAVNLSPNRFAGTTGRTARLLGA